MIRKRPLRPDRLRRPPSQFSWIDHRLVRDRHIQNVPPDGLALYLFLLTVADAEGLSYYSDARCAALLSMGPDRLATARCSLLRADLIAYEPPLYQVLSLVPPGPGAASSRPPEDRRDGRGGEAASIAEILSRLGGGGA
jgi:hypothetical protein